MAVHPRRPGICAARFAICFQLGVGTLLLTGNIESAALSVVDLMPGKRAETRSAVVLGTGLSVKNSNSNEFK